MLNTASQYLDNMDEYLLFEYLLFNIHFSPCGVRNTKKFRKISLQFLSDYSTFFIGKMIFTNILGNFPKTSGNLFKNLGSFGNFPYTEKTKCYFNPESVVKLIC